MKVEIVCNEIDCFEEELNEKINEIERDIGVIVDIKYSVSRYLHYAMIIYKEKGYAK